MRVTIIIFTVLSAVLVTISCGKEESTKVYSTPEGKVEVTEKKGDGQPSEMTIKTEEGTVTMKAGIESIPKDLGVPIYPNVEKAEGGTWSMTGMEDKNQDDFTSTILYSEDPLDKVTAFYKAKLKGSDPAIQEMDLPNMKMINMIIEKGELSTVIVLTENREKGGTNIQITKGPK